MTLLKSTVCLLLIISFAEAQQLSCSSSCETDSTAEGVSIAFSCEVTNIGGSRPVLTWHYKQNGQEVQGVSYQKQQGNIVRRDFTWPAVAPKVVPLICSARIPNVGDVKCETEECDILYSVRSVVTWPLLFASPGETITCKADGNPDPEFQWQQKKEGGHGNWEDVPDETSEEIVAELHDDGTSIELRCVATNRFGSISSPALTVSKGGAAIRTKIIIGVVVSVVILAIIGGLIYFFVLKD